MNKNLTLIWCLLAAVLTEGSTGMPSASESQSTAVPAVAGAPGSREALERARLLHTAFHGALGVMHRDFFRKNGAKAIPSRSLDDVFRAVKEEHGVTVAWLASPETAMNVDHHPRDDFERDALRQIKAGRREVSVVSGGMLRFAGAIPLQNECLKCHVKERTSLEDRFAGLSITIPCAPPAREPDK